MASYKDWNHEIAKYFTTGVPKGSPIFLSVDAEALEEIADTIPDAPLPQNPVDDFLSAVQRHVFDLGQPPLSIDKLKPDLDGLPGGIAFLGLMVFAAHNMHEDEQIAESNYFKRLREVLGLPSEEGRPKGLDQPGIEEPLWTAWSHYLVAHGFLTTAHRGDSVSQKYLNYVISQTVLRESDKAYLRKLYRDSRLPNTLDCDQLATWLTSQISHRKHLEEGFYSPDPLRAWEFFQAAHRVYDAGDWKEEPAGPASVRAKAERRIECGLYRVESLSGEVAYYAFPRQPSRTETRPLTVTLPTSGEQEQLKPLRTGLFRPLLEQDPFPPEALQLEIHGDERIKSLVFPMRDFWILTQDPEAPHGAWATWKRQRELGDHLLVLCRNGAFASEMVRFKESKLIDWTSREEFDAWTEFHGCMVLSYEWGGFISTKDTKALADALTPHSMAGISLLGGLRDPNQSAWLEGYPPILKVYGFAEMFSLRITAALGQTVLDTKVHTQEEVRLDASLQPGHYLIQANWEAGGPRRMLHIIAWDELQAHPDPDKITNKSPISAAGLNLRGAMLTDGLSEVIG